MVTSPKDVYKRQVQYKVDKSALFQYLRQYIQDNFPVFQSSV